MTVMTLIQSSSPIVSVVLFLQALISIFQIKLVKLPAFKHTSRHVWP